MPSASSWSTSPRKRIAPALAKLVVAQGFFWIQDKDLADKNKPGIDNLAKAIDLDAKDGSGWDVVDRLSPTSRPRPTCPIIRVSSARRPIRPSIRRRSRRWQGDTDRSVRMGLSAQGRRRSARRRAAEFAGDRKARPQSGARPARHRAAERSQPAGCSCMSQRRRANPALSPWMRLRRSAATRCATARMRAAGKSPAISAASPSSAWADRCRSLRQRLAAMNYHRVLNRRQLSGGQCRYEKAANDDRWD